VPAPGGKSQAKFAEIDAGSAALLDMLEPGIEHFLDTMEFGAPEVAHFIESAIDFPEPAIDVVEAGVHVSAQFADALVSFSLELLTRMPTRTASIVGTAAKAIVRSCVSLVPTN
jgi:hypothetical protein